MKSFFRRLTGFSIGPIFGAIISFLTIPVTTYFIAPDEFGKASMFTTVQTLLYTFIYLGFDQAYTREYHSVEDKRHLFQNALFVPVSFSVILTALMWVFRSEFSAFLFGDPAYEHISILFGCMLIFAIIERFILLSIRMAERAMEYSFFSLFVKLTIFVATLVLIFMGRRDFLAIVYSTIFGQILGDLALMFRYRDLFKLEADTLDKELLAKLFKFGFPLVFAASITSLLNTSGRFFLRNYASFYDLGIYSASLRVANVLALIQNIFASFWVPTAYRWRKEEKSVKHFKFISNGVLLALTFVFFMLLFFKRIVFLILSPNYLEAQYTVGLLAMTPILYTFSETTTLGIVFSGKSYYNFWISVLALIPNLLLNWWLTPQYGIIAASLASAVAYMVFCYGRTYFSERTGFKVASINQHLTIVVFFIAALVNTVETSWLTLLATAALMVVSILLQLPTLKTLRDIYRHPKEWDFE